MVPTSPTPPARVLTALHALPAGRLLLDALPGVDGVHLVGGAVRDLLLGLEPHELDLVVQADGAGAAGELARRLGGERRVHETFGTATVELPGGTRLDVATARAEDYPRPGALPVVRAATSLEDDLRRRDFSVNAIAVGLSQDVRGQLTTFPGALEDLAAGRLRVLHDRSFQDDATRLVRLARYGTRLHLTLHPRTEQLARAAFDGGMPATVGASRWARELVLLLGEAEAVEGLALVAELAGGRVPGPPSGLRVDRPVLHAVDELVPPDGSREHALLAALCAELADDELAAWLSEAHLERPGVVLDAAGDPLALASAMQGAPAPSALADLLRRRPAEAVAVAGAFGAHDAARRWLEDLRHVRLEITGDDLIAAGVAPGRELGRRLDAAMAARLDGRAPSAATQRAAALNAEVL
jgi:tRNA nucleotidyltransferase (CCA-adding enzyme)